MRRLQHRLRPALLVATVVWLVLTPRMSLGQFLYLDTNGDAQSSPEDVLNPVGEPTQVSVYLDTTRNPDSSVAYCTTGSEPLSIVSYEFILHATGGTVTFGAYTNVRPTMGTSFGAGSNATDFYAGFGGSTILPSGLYQLGALSVTVQSGSPTLNPATTTPLDPHFGTSFGTQCTGHDEDNTYKLGLDWYGISGCGPPGGGEAAPASAAPPIVQLALGTPAEIAAEFFDPDQPGSLVPDVWGFPPDLRAVRGTQQDGRTQIRLYGVLNPAIRPGSSFVITWSVTDGSRAESVRTDLRVISKGPAPDFGNQVAKFITAHYQHGMPRRQLRGLGTGALPVLTQMLTDVGYRKHWHKAASGIGFIGDPSYFDTLHGYVWERFQGPIDLDTYKAIQGAQVSLSAMATVSMRVLDYLQTTAVASAWRDLPWRVAGDLPSYTADMMASMSIIALGYTDSDRAAEILRGLLESERDENRIKLIRGSLRVNERVRAKGLPRVWDDQDPRSSSETKR